MESVRCTSFLIKVHITVSHALLLITNQSNMKPNAKVAASTVHEWAPIFLALNCPITSVNVTDAKKNSKTTIASEHIYKRSFATPSKGAKNVDISMT